MPKEPFLVYCYGQTGKYGKPTVMHGIREAADYAATMGTKYPEVRMCDALDQLVFHIVGGKIVFPIAGAFGNGDTEAEKPKGQVGQSDARPYVVFAVQMPTPTCHRQPGESDLPELSLPFVHAAGAEEAVSLVAEANMENPDYVVADAMDYDRLMEIADMLVGEDPSYPKGVKTERRPLDFGWAIRRLGRGEKVRFSTWDPQRYIVRLPNGNVVDHNGVPWQPYRTEVMSPRWEVYR